VSLSVRATHLNVCLAQVNVQGAEKLALWGARDTITRCKPAIVYKKATEKNKLKVTEVS
jgi:hypothetical protein